MYPCVSLCIIVYPCVSLCIPMYHCVSLCVPVCPCVLLCVPVCPCIQSFLSLMFFIIPVFDCFPSVFPRLSRKADVLWLRPLASSSTWLCTGTFSSSHFSVQILILECVFLLHFSTQTLFLSLFCCSIVQFVAVLILYEVHWADWLTPMSRLHH